VGSRALHYIFVPGETSRALMHGAADKSQRVPVYSHSLVSQEVSNRASPDLLICRGKGHGSAVRVGNLNSAKNR
jgi:hypothetical protein